MCDALVSYNLIRTALVFYNLIRAGSYLRRLFCSFSFFIRKVAVYGAYFAPFP